MQFPTLPQNLLDDSSDASGVRLHVEHADAPVLDATALGVWLRAVATQRGYALHRLTYVLVSDDALHAMNVEYLAHDTLTDIITFDLRDDPSAAVVEGECYISLDRVRDNAAAFGELARATRLEDPVEEELQRVMAHGLLHLCGLGDKSPAEAAAMRAAEDAALALR